MGVLAERASSQGFMRRTQLRQAVGSERAIHHERVDKAEAGMGEGLREAADDGEAEALPEPHRALVAADDEIELHGAKTSAPRVRERVLAHGGGDPASARRGPRHVAPN